MRMKTQRAILNMVLEQTQLNVTPGSDNGIAWQCRDALSGNGSGCRVTFNECELITFAALWTGNS